MVKIAPSILSADFSILKDQVQIAEEAGDALFPLSFLSFPFFPNLTFLPLIFYSFLNITYKPLYFHLMIYPPYPSIKSFVEAGADVISVHVEAAVHLHRTLNFIRDLGVKAGVAINPASSIDFLEHILDSLDLVLIMSVNPGFGGQSFIPHSARKIRATRELIDALDREVHLEVDGGVDPATALKVVSAGADVLVAGSAIFGAPDIRKALQKIRDAVSKI